MKIVNAVHNKKYLYKVRDIDDRFLEYYPYSSFNWYIRNNINEVYGKILSSNTNSDSIEVIWYRREENDNSYRELVCEVEVKDKNNNTICNTVLTLYVNVENIEDEVPIISDVIYNDSEIQLIEYPPGSGFYIFSNTCIKTNRTYSLKVIGSTSVLKFKWEIDYGGFWVNDEYLTRELILDSTTEIINGNEYSVSYVNFMFLEPLREVYTIKIYGLTDSTISSPKILKFKSLPEKILRRYIENLYDIDYNPNIILKEYVDIYQDTSWVFAIKELLNLLNSSQYKIKFFIKYGRNNDLLNEEFSGYVVNGITGNRWNDNDEWYQIGDEDILVILNSDIGIENPMHNEGENFEFCTYTNMLDNIFKFRVNLNKFLWNPEDNIIYYRYRFKFKIVVYDKNLNDCKTEFYSKPIEIIIKSCPNIDQIDNLVLESVECNDMNDYDFNELDLIMDGSFNEITCPSGYFWNGYECVPECPSGYMAVSGVCIPICPSGYKYYSGSGCIPEEEINCPSGTRWNEVKQECECDDSIPYNCIDCISIASSGIMVWECSGFFERCFSIYMGSGYTMLAPVQSSIWIYNNDNDVWYQLCKNQFYEYRKYVSNECLGEGNYVYFSPVLNKFIIFDYNGVPLKNSDFVVIYINGNQVILRKEEFINCMKLNL